MSEEPSMVDNLTSGLPPMASGGVYTCPVDGCDETWTVPGPTTEWFRDALRVGGVTIASFEFVLECHIQTHTAVEFLGTIQARDIRIAELERALDGWCH